MSENGSPSRLQNQEMPNHDRSPRDQRDDQNPEYRDRYDRSPRDYKDHEQRRRSPSRDSRRSPPREDERREQNGNQQHGDDDRRRSYSPQDHQQRQRSQSPPPSYQLYVGGLSHSVTVDDLRDLFEPFGEVTQIVPKGRYGFVEFTNQKAVEEALRNTNGMKFHGYQLNVEISKRRDGKGRRGGPSSEDKCWNCGEIGHWLSQCPKGPPPRDRGRRRGSYSRSPPRRRRSYSRDRRDDGRSKELREGLCFVCKERGHRKMDCPALNNRRGPPRDYYRRSSRSRSPPRRRDDDYYRDRRSPPRRYDSPRRRFPSRSRSPPPQYQQRRYRDSRSPRRSPPRRMY